jgi:hypothetical protein
LSRLIARDHVYIYCTSDFDEQVHEELKRSRRIIHRNLQDFFTFGNTQERELADFVYLDILNEKEEETEKVE